MTIGAKLGMPSPPMGMPPNPYGGMPPPPPAPMGPPPGFNPNMGGNAAPRADTLKGSAAPRRKMFGDYLESTLSRNMPPQPVMPVNATSMGQMDVFTGQQMAPQMAMRQRRPMPMPQQRRPQMANRGGIVGFDEGGAVHEHPHRNEILSGTDGTYTIINSDGGTQMVRDLSALQSAYPNLKVSESGLSYDDIRAGIDANSANTRTNLEALTRAGLSNLPGGSETGIDVNDVAKWSGNNPKTLAMRYPDYGLPHTEGFTATDYLVREAKNMGKTALGRYLDPETIAGMTDKQLLAASELFTQGGGAKSENYLSVEDLDFIANQANDFSGSVYSPTQQALTFGAGTEADRYGSSPSVSSPSVSNSYVPPASTYTATPVDDRFNVPIDYDKFVGDTVASIGNYEDAALYGPNVTAPATVSQVISDGSGGLGYTNGPFMSAISGIGGINVPARPVELDIFDWLSDPAYGTIGRGGNNLSFSGKNAMGFNAGGPVRHFDMGGHAHPHSDISDDGWGGGWSNSRGEVESESNKIKELEDWVNSNTQKRRRREAEEKEIKKKYTDTSDMSALDQLAESNLTSNFAHNLVTDNLLAGIGAGTTRPFMESAGFDLFGSNTDDVLDAVVNYENTANDVTDPYTDNEKAYYDGVGLLDYIDSTGESFRRNVSEPVDFSTTQLAENKGATEMLNMVGDVADFDHYDDKRAFFNDQDAAAALNDPSYRGVSLGIDAGDPRTDAAGYGGNANISIAPIVDTSVMDVPAFNNTPYAPRDDNTSDIRSGLGSVTDGKDPYSPIGTGMTSAAANSATVAALKGYEGFRNKAYDDRKKGSNDPVYRAGFGSDTYTDPKTGEYYTVGENTVVTLEQAEADLARRVEDDFIPAVVDAVGMSGWANMDAGTRAALTSIAYNYGQNAFKPAYTSEHASMKRLVEAMKTGNKEKIATAIEGLTSNPDRRRREAAMVRSGEGPGGVKSSALYGASNLESNTPSSDMSKIDTQLQDSVSVRGLSKFLSNIGGAMFFGLGKGLVDDLVSKTEAQRANVVKMHTDALNMGATPQYDDDGKYIGYDKSTMGTFSDKVLAAGDDIDIFMPHARENASGLKDADGNVINDITRFQQVFDAQSRMAEIDPYGSNTENGFITSDGREFVVTYDGKILEADDSVVGTGENWLNSGVGTGADINTIINTITGGGETGNDDDDTKNYSIIDGEYVCNNPNYVYDSETDVCVPEEESKAETIDGGLNRGSSSSSFKKYKPSQVASSIASYNPAYAPYNQGGMVNSAFTSSQQPFQGNQHPVFNQLGRGISSAITQQVPSFVAGVEDQAKDVFGEDAFSQGNLGQLGQIGPGGNPNWPYSLPPSKGNGLYSEDLSSLGGMSPFAGVLGQRPSPPPISGLGGLKAFQGQNVNGYNEGGMVNTNRMVDEFLVALGA